MVFFFIIGKYCYNGVFFFNYIISEDKQSYQEFQNKYMISTNFLEYYGIAGVVPKRWKKLISEYGSLHDIKNNIIDRFKTAKKPCKYFYKLYLENIKESPVRPQNKWAQELGIQIDDWRYIYFSLFRATRNTKLQNISVELLLRTLFFSSVA